MFVMLNIPPFYMLFGTLFQKNAPKITNHKNHIFHKRSKNNEELWLPHYKISPLLTQIGAKNVIFVICDLRGVSRKHINK